MSHQKFQPLHLLTKEADNDIHINAFIQKECRLGAMLGPFTVVPFEPWCQVSPLMTHPKKNPESCRVIIDLSFLLGKSVNSGIVKGFYQGSPFSFSLPSNMTLMDQLTKSGTGSWLWLADPSRAYRQLRVYPLSVPLLAIKLKGQYYLEPGLTFRLSHLCPGMCMDNKSGGLVNEEAGFLYALLSR